MLKEEGGNRSSTTGPASRRRAALALASPLLIALGVLGLSHRSGGSRWQAMPALLIGAGLLLTSLWRRRHRRRELLRQLRAERRRAGQAPLPEVREREPGR